MIFLVVLEEEIRLVLSSLQRRGSMAIGSSADDKRDETFKSEKRSVDQTPHQHQWSQAFLPFLISFFNLFYFFSNFCMHLALQCKSGFNRQQVMSFFLTHRLANSVAMVW